MYIIDGLAVTLSQGNHLRIILFLDMTLNSYITVCTAGGDPVKTVKTTMDILNHSHCAVC